MTTSTGWKGIAGKESFIFGSLMLLTFALSLHMVAFVNEFAPVILVRDRWSSLNPLFYDRSFWEGFTHQHGPHRMGLAYIFFTCTAKLSDWNARWDMFLQAAIYIFSALLALRLKRLLTGRYQWADLLIPMVFINLQCSTTVFENPYVHGLIPFFALLIALSWFIKNSLMRWTALSLLSTVALFSGFGLVVGGTFVGIELLGFLKNRGKAKTFALLLPLGGIAYILATQRHGGDIGLSNDWVFNISYLLLLGGNFFFGGPLPWLLPIGLLFAGGFFGLLFLNRATFIQGQQVPYTKVLLLLLGSSLLFMVLNLLGRTDQGLASAGSARYIPGTMPLMFGIYLLILKLKAIRQKKVFLAAFSFVVLVSQVKTLNTDGHISRQHAKFKKWEACLKANNNYNQCYGQIKFPLVNDPEESRVQQKLDFLKENKLSIFKEE